MTGEEQMDTLRQEKIQKFEEFVDRRLKPDLVRAIAERYHLCTRCFFKGITTLLLIIFFPIFLQGQGF